jgi:hypothetical protein
VPDEVNPGEPMAGREGDHPAAVLVWPASWIASGINGSASWIQETTKL